MRAGLIEALSGADIVIYDTHYNEDEYAKFPHWGHGTPRHALEICREAKAKKLVLFHHAPGRNDDQQDELLEETRAIAGSVEVIAAQEGMRVEVP